VEPLSPWGGYSRYALATFHSAAPSRQKVAQLHNCPFAALQQVRQLLGFTGRALGESVCGPANRGCHSQSLERSNARSTGPA
jgi:hypothetical protein